MFVLKEVCSWLFDWSVMSEGKFIIVFSVGEVLLVMFLFEIMMDNIN